VTFILDHDVPADVARMLEREGHTALSLSTVLPPTTSDAEVFKYAAHHGLVLITCNRDDFLELTKNHASPGLIVLIRRRTRHMECARLLRLLRNAGDQGIKGKVNFA
jgi:predicted nuclease of predicted toxin-antitoxin system